MTVSPPTRTARDRCWAERDAYYVCLDSAGVEVPGDEGSKCQKEKKSFEGECAKSWVDYFNKRRVLGFRQQAMIARAEAENAERRKEEAAGLKAEGRR